MLGALLSVTIGACASSRRGVAVDELVKENEQREHVYRLASGDLVDVSTWGQEPFSGTYRVRGDGRITLALIGDVTVAGLTPQQAATTIAQRLEGIILEPKVTVSVSEPRVPMVSVLGEVRMAGHFELHDGDSVLDLIARAQGLTEFADTDAIYVLRDDQRIRFSFTDLVRGVGAGLSFRLRDHDVIVVED